ncbi:MAG: DNA polymerase domain-containing protein [Chloroflexota bacterium]
MMYEQYGLPGVLEQARVTALPVQEVARKSPGAGITAMQMLTALRRDILVPHQKQQAERFKSALDLIHADRGGLVYQPLIGLHQDVAEIDFTSMYPSIMVRFNISPEVTSDGMKHEIGDMTAAGCPPAPLSAPELASRILPPASPDGLIPATLRPLLAKRIAMKEQLAALHPLDCRYRPLKARAAALKWLLVVCFGYLGYKNARFGRIEGHEAVTAYGREMLLRAKEAAEDHGYTVLHMYVDGLWIRHPTDTAGGLAAVMAEITRRTDLPIALEGIYRWVAFLPSRMDERVPVANRYFGVFDDGSFKVRGIEARRHDTPPFIAATQMRLLEQLAAVTDPAVALPAVVRWLGDQLADLRAGRVPPAELLVSHRLSRELGDYRARPPGARAAARLVAAGKPQPPGRRVRFIYTRGEPGVYAWGDPQPLDPARIDLARYEDLLLRAAANLLQPFIDEPSLRAWATGQAHQLRLPFPRRAPSRRTKRE